MPLYPGDQLGHYKILSMIGKGGMGEVYRARDPRLNRDVAIKVSARQFSERFEREARAIAALNHTNVCHLYDVGPNYLVMELVEGETLRGPLKFDEAMPIIRQLIDGIEAGHDKNIVHRDLKPANIKITPEGVVKILDYGLAKATAPEPDGAPDGDPENSPTLTMGETKAGTILGTAAYMAPEQARGKTADKRSDIWSFGVVVYELLTGKRAFAGESVVETLGAVINKEPDWPEVSPDVPPRALRLLKWCLEKDRKRRLQSIGDARRVLEEEPDAGLQSRDQRERFRPDVWLGIAAGVLLVALAALAFVHFREKPPAAELVRFEIPAPSGVTLGYHLALSPDGRKLAFLATGKGSMPMVWIRPLDSREARPLAGTEGATEPTLFWSPDSRFIAFWSGGKLKRIDATGGPAQTICDAATLRSGFWTPDNKIVFGGVGPLFQVSASGGTLTPLTMLDHSRQEVAHVAGALLPDGRHFVYLRVSFPLDIGAIYVGSLDAKPDQQSAKRLLPDISTVVYVPSAEAAPAPGFLLFVRGVTLASPVAGGTLMAQPFNPERLEFTGDAVPIAEQVFPIGGFSATASGGLAYRVAGAQTNCQLTWYDRQGKVLATPGEAGEYGNLALSPDAAQVAYERGTGLSLFEFARGVNTPFTFGNPANSPAWSPDGSRIAFISVRDGGFGIYEKASNGAGQEQLLFQSPDFKVGPAWSHDGRFLLYGAASADGKTGLDLWVLPMGQGSDPKPVAFPFLRTEFNEGDGRFSPDGRWIAYGSDQSGRSEIYVLPFDASNPGSPGAGGLRKISKDGGADVRWRGDGKELFYVAPDGNIMSVEVNGTGAAFQSGTPKVLFKSLPGLNSWDVTADGKRFLIAAEPGGAAAAAAPSSYQVVLNWPAMLRH